MTVEVLNERRKPDEGNCQSHGVKADCLVHYEVN